MSKITRWRKFFSKIKAASFLALLIFIQWPAVAENGPPVIGIFSTTYYFVPDESQFPPSHTDVIQDLEGKILSRVNDNFKRELDVEGTGILRNGRTVNFAARVNDEIRYRFSKPKWGWGVGQCKLKPYRSLAVDPDLIRLGTVVFIPAVKGALLPDGQIHDGIFYAEDIGSKILKYHVDLFASDGNGSGDFFIKLGLNRGKRIEVYKMKDPDPQGCQTKSPVRRDSNAGDS